MPIKPAVLVVLANGKITVSEHGDVEVVLVDFDSIRDYETTKEDVEALLQKVKNLPEGDGHFRAGRANALFGLMHSEPMTREFDDDVVVS